MKPSNSGRAALAALAAACLAFAVSARADELAEAQALLKQGQARAALETADKGLATKPRDAQLRFLKGLILTEMNRQPEAIAVFTKLTEDFPELPEPYNNLAVIYAQQRQYEKAKTALEMAIRTHPSYATAHENLGDIYARLASQAYDKALQLDSTNVMAQTKLAMIRDLMSATAKGAAARTTAAGKPVPPVAVASPSTAAEPRPVPAEARPAAPIAEASAPAPKAPPAEPAPAQAAASPSPDDIDAVTRTVRDWAAAWAGKDIKAYLAHYGRDFRTGRQSRGDWEQERRRRIDKPGAIQVTVDNLKVELGATDHATARFHQVYRSAGFKSATDKTLELTRRNGRWLIVQERIGS